MMSEVDHFAHFLSHLTQNCHFVALSWVPADYLQVMLQTFLLANL